MAMLSALNDIIWTRSNCTAAATTLLSKIHHSVVSGSLRIYAGESLQPIMIRLKSIMIFALGTEHV